MMKKLGRPSAWVILYALVGTLLTAGYGWAGHHGWDPDSERGEIPADVRQSAHGYRNYTYWHTHHTWVGGWFWHTPYRGYRWGK